MNTKPGYDEVLAAAINEVRQSRFRQAVEAEKACLIAALSAPKPSFWQRLVNSLPFTITFNWKTT